MAKKAQNTNTGTVQGTFLQYPLGASEIAQIQGLSVAETELLDFIVGTSEIGYKFSLGTSKDGKEATASLTDRREGLKTYMCILSATAPTPHKALVALYAKHVLFLGGNWEWLVDAPVEYR